MPEHGGTSPLATGARYGHTNLIARDWHHVAAFYETVFGCIPVPPERDYRGPDLERATAVRGAALRGAHLRLPGHGPDGPTLEIYSYEPALEGPPPAANRTGWGHIAFEVVDVEATRTGVLDAGGNRLGDIIMSRTADGRRVTWCYMTDPEGNIIELQSWTPAE